jgi:hypothetical protein
MTILNLSMTYYFFALNAAPDIAAMLAGCTAPVFLVLMAASALPKPYDHFLNQSPHLLCDVAHKMGIKNHRPLLTGGFCTSIDSILNSFFS